MTSEIRAPDPSRMARSTDPVTSHLAAQEAVGLSLSHQVRILRAMRHGQELGAEEIGKACGIAPYEVRKRLPELQESGLVRVTSSTRRTSSGRKERLWVRARAA